METIANVVNTATKAIWGEQPNPTTTNETAGSEPVSGMQGKGTVTDPYDQGNAEDPAEPKGKTDLTSTTTSTATSAPVSSETESLTQKTSSLALDDTPSKYQIPTNIHNAAAGGEPKPLESTTGTGVTGASAHSYKPMGSDVIPSESSSNPGVAPSSGAVPTFKQQGADKPQDIPEDDAVGALKAKKDDAEATLAKRDPNDHSGEPMHMHNGTSGGIPKTQEERRDSKAGMPGGQEHGKEPRGTGEQWVKTTGFAADGGDFDVTKPGAGKEADRILEGKGIHKDDKGAVEHSPDSHKEKVSKLEKIKEKLHIGHKH